MISEAQLEATGLAEKYLATYRLVHSTDPLMSNEAAAKKIGCAGSTVKRHLDVVAKRLEDPTAMPQLALKPSLEQSNPDKFAAAAVALSGPKRNVAAVAREVGICERTADKIAKQLDGELQPLGRELKDIRVEDLTKRFGTLARDAVDAITEEKLNGATAQQLAIIAGVAADKWQLLRGMPTQRMEIGDRRNMNELLNEVIKEAQRRHIEIDVTPEGEVTAKKSPYRNAAQTRLMKKIQTGDPPETLVGG